MKAISLKLPEALDARLAAMAKRRQTSKSAVAREAFEFFFSNGRKRKKPSLHDLMKRWIGPPGGPGDVSYNERYMEGYGK